MNQWRRLSGYFSSFWGQFYSITCGLFVLNHTASESYQKKEKRGPEEEKKKNHEGEFNFSIAKLI